MCDTLAKLVTDVLAALGFPPKEWLEVEDAARACLKSLAFFNVSLTQSNQNQVIAKKDFQPTTREHSLTDVRGVPLWVERKAGTEPNESWVYVHACNLATIEESRSRGEDRCAFFNEGGRLKVKFTYTPNGETHRLRYDPDPSLGETIDDPLTLPAAYYPLYSARARRAVIPVVMMNAAKCENKPEEFQLKAWQASLAEAVAEMDDWQPLWRDFKSGSRGAARGRMRRPVLAR